ncbi:MAG: hypothetical protein HY457_01860 [Parcubacteria group bacterium]|nr:hypothetical protein [Parcubacteria group bacterium]
MRREGDDPFFEERLIGGFARLVSGGMRNEIKLSRPWQRPLPIAPEKCPFCTKPQEELPLPGIPFGWRLIPNLFTPHARHRLIIPDGCWDEPKLQRLGGFSGIFQALQTARLVIDNDMAERGGVEMAVFIHVGQSAGQNIGHPHWHIAEVSPEKTLKTRTDFERDLPALFVHRDQGLQVAALGARAGECLIVPTSIYNPTFETVTAASVAAVLEWLITRCNEKFASTEGRPPEFTVLVRISADGKFRYADYCPILSMWGAMEYALAHFEGGPITLPWPHQVTAEHLRG